MALTSIQPPPQNKAVIYFERGNVGTVEDIQAKGENELQIPLIVAGGGGGNIFIMSE
ncbi:MAG: hypothetical protein WC609_03270 [Candidatus Paceibacterota bacterium]|jgi:hypothetical protein